MLTVFCGKGGVGKTVLSLAQGLRQARSGRRTVVVSSHPLGELSLSVSLHGLKDRFPEAAPNLFVVHIDPREIISAKIRQQIPSRLLAEAVLTSRLYRSLVEIAPGLKEIAFLARLLQLSETRTGEGVVPGFDSLVWDAPATGHLLQTLRASIDFRKYMSGPFAALGEDLAAFMSDPSRIRIVPVTTPEEMAVDETIELCGRLAREIDTRPDAVVCNIASPLLSKTGDEVRLLRESISDEALEAGMGFVFERHEAERAQYERLRAAVGCGVFVQDQLTGWRTDLDLVAGVADEVCLLLEGAAR
jgi:hypothetical protein